jgi:hypothetical protein
VLTFLFLFSGPPVPEFHPNDILQSQTKPDLPIFLSHPQVPKQSKIILMHNVGKSIEIFYNAWSGQYTTHKNICARYTVTLWEDYAGKWKAADQCNFTPACL